jgi:hypothetical protein
VHAVVGGFIPGNTSFLVMNPDFHFVLAMDVIVCTADVNTKIHMNRFTLFNLKFVWTTHGLIRLSKSLSPVECEAILVYFSYLFLLINKRKFLPMIVNYEKSLKMKEINRSGESKKEKERSTKDCKVNIEQFERH